MTVIDPLLKKIIQISVKYKAQCVTAANYIVRCLEWNGMKLGYRVNEFVLFYFQISK